MKDPQTRESVAKFYHERMKDKLPAATRIALIDGFAVLGSKLSPDEFDNSMVDVSHEVRQAAVRQFLEARSSYEISEQIRRFRTAFQIKPYQVRLEALRNYASLSQSERAELRTAFSNGLCKSEKQAEVKSVCLKIERFNDDEVDRK
jgi:acyl-CoA reductase-like NAD-dependent aldehyde dehydrogenase